MSGDRFYIYEVSSTVDAIRYVMAPEVPTMFLETAMMPKYVRLVGAGTARSCAAALRLLRGENL